MVVQILRADHLDTPLTRCSLGMGHALGAGRENIQGIASWNEALPEPNAIREKVGLQSSCEIGGPTTREIGCNPPPATAPPTKLPANSKGSRLACCSMSWGMWAARLSVLSGFRKTSASAVPVTSWAVDSTPAPMLFPAAWSFRPGQVINVPRVGKMPMRAFL